MDIVKTVGIGKSSTFAVSAIAGKDFGVLSISSGLAGVSSDVLISGVADLYKIRDTVDSLISELEAVK